jgi:diguanylate cyclase (GGDEF)-like protein
MTTEKQTILVLDGLPENFELLSQLLGQDYRLLYAPVGQQGMEIASSQKPDIILMDVVMPDMDGFEICARLKANPFTCSIPVIFVMDKNREADEGRGLEFGAVDYLTRPLSPAIVQARVRNHLELKRYRDFQENLSSTDGLTGIPNRRHFDQILEREWRRAMRNRSSISLIMMDIDFFKDYNDYYGHLSGDDCLRHVAQVLAGSVRRPFDLVARYGGEEFACVLPETETEGAVCVANKLQQQVTALKIPHPLSVATDHIALSLGVATLVPCIGQSHVDLIARAERFLCEAKHNGRNQLKSAKLPASPVPVLQKQNSAQMLTQLRILAVDDVPENLELVRFYLADSPVTLVEASSGEDALLRFAVGRFDCVLLDIHMPGMSGYETLHEIRAFESARRMPRTPVICISTGTHADDFRKALEAGFDAYLPRPVKRSELQTAIFTYSLSGAVWSSPEQPKLQQRVRAAELSFREMIPRALERLKVCAGELEEAGRRGRFAEAGLLGHTIKGLGMTFGLTEAELLGEEIEGAVRVEDAGRIKKLAGSVRELTAG